MFAPETDKKILWATNMYDQWKLSGFIKNAPDINFAEKYSKSEWHESLCAFITQVKKLDGKDFPCRTLYEIIVCIQMYFETRGMNWKLLDDDEFCQLKFTLDNVMKLHTQQGVLQPVQQAGILTVEQEEILWSKGLLGTSNPVQLQCTLLYTLSIHLALCAGKEHRNLLSIGSPNSQLKFSVRNGESVVIYKENNATKTNQGGL